MMGYCEGETKWVFGLFGVLFIIVGYLLWAGSWTIEQAIGVAIIIIGLGHLAESCIPINGKK